MKTQNDIERDFYTFVKNGLIGAAIRGSVYRSESRPDNANTEDAVVAFLSGTDEQIQQGQIILNIYVSDIRSGTNGRLIKDFNRIGYLQAEINRFVGTFADTDYLIWTDTTPNVYPCEEISQHIIAARINFKRFATQ